MKSPPPQNDYVLNGLFPVPTYITKRTSALDSTEEKGIKDIIEDAKKD